MPAKPLSPEQKADAARLKEAFDAWRAARRDRGEPISQEAVASQLGFGQSALSQYLNGHIPLNAAVLVKFCDMLGVAPQDISPDIAGQAVENSSKWAPTESALEALAMDAFVVHGAKVEPLRPGKQPAGSIPKWLRQAAGNEVTYIPDLRATLADGSEVYVEVKSTRGTSLSPSRVATHLAKLAAEHPRDFLLLVADGPEIPRLVARWLSYRDKQDAPLQAQEEAPPTHHAHTGGALRNQRPVWVVGSTQGGMPARVWTDADYPVGATEEFADVSTTDPHAFACRVVGDSMVPRYMPGEFALVEPSTTPELEDDVLVRLQTGETMLKRLLSRRGGVRLGSYNTTEVMSFREEEITWMYYVAHPIPVRRIRQRIDLDAAPVDGSIEQRPSAIRVKAEAPAGPMKRRIHLGRKAE